jgi:PP-loop superfamily ATP-utilizing enzyme
LEFSVFLSRGSATITGMLQEKERDLRAIFQKMGSCIVAFSGGVDSAYLALIAHQELGSAALAVTAESPSYPTYQRNLALDLVKTYGFRHEFIASAEMQDSNYTANPNNRCYFCKHELYSLLQMETTSTIQAITVRAVRREQSWKSAARSSRSA